MNKNFMILLIKMYVSIFGKIVSYILPPILAFVTLSFFNNTLNQKLFVLIAAILFILVGIFLTKLHQVFLEYSAISDCILEILKSDMVKYSDDISKRPGRMYPDVPMVNLKNYISAISSIKTNGYIEFNNCQNEGLNIKGKKYLTLHTETPGMSKYFMILSVEGDEYPIKNGYIRIYPNYDLAVDGRDFTETWYNHIFPILGHLSNSISEKLANGTPGGSSGDYYTIQNFKVTKKGKNGEVLFRINL